MQDILDPFSHPLVQTLGWTLIHFIWQGMVVGLLVAGALGLLRHSAPGVRYAMACGGLLVMLALPVVTWWSLWGGPSRPLPIATGSAEGMPGMVPGWLAGPGVAQGPEVGLPWAVGVWVAGVLLLSLWRTGGWAYTWYLRNREIGPAGRCWQEQLARLGNQLGVRRPVRLLESLRVGAPVVIGWLRPVILVPVGLFSGLSLGQVEAILAHELAHIRRHDYLVNVLQTMAETLLFYHPAVWWTSRQIRVEREYCCDDAAARLCGNRRVYAEALMALELWRDRTPQLAVAAAGGRLLDRVRRQVVQSHQGGGAASTRWPGMALAAPVLLLVLVLLGRAEQGYSAIRVQGEILHYPFTANTADHRSVGPAFVVNGAIPVANHMGVPAAAYGFDGGYRDVEMSAPVSGDFKTIAFWARSEVVIDAANQRGHHPIGESNAATRCSGFYFGSTTSALDNEIITLAWEGSYKAYYWTTATFPRGINTAWHCYTFVWSEADRAYMLYVDGESKGRPDLTLWNNYTEDAPPTSHTPTYIRSAQWHIGRFGTSQIDGWLGALDGLRIYNRSLRPQEITALFREAEVTAGQEVATVHGTESESVGLEPAAGSPADSLGQVGEPTPQIQEGPPGEEWAGTLTLANVEHTAINASITSNDERCQPSTTELRVPALGRQQVKLTGSARAAGSKGILLTLALGGTAAGVGEVDGGALDFGTDKAKGLGTQLYFHYFDPGVKYTVVTVDRADPYAPANWGLAGGRALGPVLEVVGGEGLGGLGRTVVE